MRKLIALRILMLLALAGVALADTEFKFTYSDPLYSLQGVLTASPASGGAYVATSVSGTLTWLTQSPQQTYPLVLVPVGTVSESANGDEFFDQDNLLFPNNPGQLLTMDFISFMVPTPTAVSNYRGGTIVAIWANGGGDYGSETASALGGWGAGSHTGGTFTLTLVPEPDAVILLIAMLVGVIVSARAVNKRVA